MRQGVPSIDGPPAIRKPGVQGDGKPPSIAGRPGRGGDASMKHTVKAWALFWKGDKRRFYRRSAFWAVFANKAAAKRNAFPENVVRQVTVIYDDGKRRP